MNLPVALSNSPAFFCLALLSGAATLTTAVPVLFPSFPNPLSSPLPSSGNLNSRKISAPLLSIFLALITVFFAWSALQHPAPVVSKPPLPPVEPQRPGPFGPLVDPVALYNSAFALERANEWANALQLYWQLEKISPSFPGLRMEMAVCERNIGDLPRAEEYASMALSDITAAGATYSNVKIGHVEYNRACIRFLRGNIDGAAEDLGNALGHGFPYGGSISGDADLQAMGSHPRLKSYVDAIQKDATNPIGANR